MQIHTEGARLSIARAIDRSSTARSRPPPPYLSSRRNERAQFTSHDTLLQIRNWPLASLQLIYYTCIHRHFESIKILSSSSIPVLLRLNILYNIPICNNFINNAWLSSVDYGDYKNRSIG